MCYLTDHLSSDGRHWVGSVCMPPIINCSIPICQWQITQSGNPKAIHIYSVRSPNTVAVTNNVTPNHA